MFQLTGVPLLLIFEFTHSINSKCSIFLVMSTIAFSERHVRSHISLHCTSQIRNFETPIISFSYHIDTWTHIYGWRNVICFNEWSERRGWDLRVLLSVWMVVSGRPLWFNTLIVTFHDNEEFLHQGIRCQRWKTCRVIGSLVGQVDSLAISILPNTFKYSGCYRASLKT